MLRSILIAAFLAAAIAADYGVDCSFPIHSKDFKCGDVLGDRKKFYEDFMEGCRKFYGDKASRCDRTEEDRIIMSQRQPQSMVNYTSTGFKKMKAPKEVWELLISHWERNKDNMKQERWPAGNVYVNHWESPTYMVSVEDTSMRGGGLALKQAIWNAVKPTIEAWTGMEQKPTSMYGIRAYTEGAVLNPHVDRLPLVSSCIINVDQDVDEDWPLEVYDRHDRAVNVTMQPGDLVLYESGSLIHGRPFPLKGRYYANIFIHFEPTGRPLGDTSDDYLDTLDDFYPPYLLPDSPELSNWASRHPQGWKKPAPNAPIQQVFSPDAHVAAATGEYERMQELARKNRKLLVKTDHLGWQPIHEAARSGNKDIVQLLIENGADMNARTGSDGKGASPLNLALMHHSTHHEVSQYLIRLGAKNYKDGEL